MTGPDHYLAAERLLGEILNHAAGSQREMGKLAEAQVHATLALAAATALANTGEMFVPDAEAWEKVASDYAARDVTQPGEVTP